MLRRQATGSASLFLSSHGQGSPTPSLVVSPAKSALDSPIQSQQSIQSQITWTHHKPTLSYNIPLKITPCSGLNQLEVHFLEAVMRKNMQVDKYLIGPSFRDRHLQSFAEHLSTEMPHVKDAFIACASRLTRGEQEQRIADGQSIGYRRAAAAIASLRTTTFDSGNGLSMLLILGLAIVTFMLHYSRSLPVCQHILGLVSSMCEKDNALLRRLDNDGAAFLLGLVGTELEECIVGCQVPTIRIASGTFDWLIDRFIGVSAPIFTHLYDICCLLHNFKELHHNSGQYSDESLEKARCHLQQDLEGWKPSVSASELGESISPSEIITVMGQAKILRLAGLLILHRLRYAYGTEDEAAMAMSTSILRELDTITELTGRTIPFSDIPHLVACFELEDFAARQEALEKTQTLINFSQYCCKEQKTSLVAFWSSRDKATKGTLFWTDVNACMN